jgi:hypothetical protein
MKRKEVSVPSPHDPLPATLDIFDPDHVLHRVSREAGRNDASTEGSAQPFRLENVFFKIQDLVVDRSKGRGVGSLRGNGRKRRRQGLSEFNLILDIPATRPE